MRKSRFQKQYKQKKSPQRPQCHKWHCHHRGHLFLYTCAGRSKPLLSVFILPSSYSRKYRRMQDTASVSLCLRLFLAFLIFSCLQTNLFAIATPSVDLFLWPFSATKPCVVKPVCLPLQTKQQQTIPFYDNVPPEEHLQPQAMHAWQWRLQNFRHGDRKAQLSPFIVAPRFVSSRGALRHSIRSIFLFASPCMPTFPCRLQDGISVSFSLLGQR